MQDELDPIIDGLKPLCLCKGIAKKVFLRHIAAGVATLAELQRLTGAGKGSCQGKRCTPKLLELLEKQK